MPSLTAPCPLTHLGQLTGIADPADEDLSAPILRAVQEALAVTNHEGPQEPPPMFIHRCIDLSRSLTSSYGHFLAVRDLQHEDPELLMLVTLPPIKHDTLLPPRDQKRTLARQPAPKVQTLGRSLRPLKRQHALSLIPGPSTAGHSHSSAGKQPRSIIQLDSDGEDVAPPPYSSPQPSRYEASVVDHYTDDKARFNMVGDENLMALTRSHREELFQQRENSRSFWLLDGPNRQRYADPRFPACLSLYIFGGLFATCVIGAGPVGLCPITNFIFAIATTDGVSGPSYTNFLNMLRVCIGCSGHFTPPAFNQHLLVAGNFQLCGNHPSRPIVSCVGSAAYGGLLKPSPFAFGRHPAHPHSAPYREFGSLTALGIALSALNTKLGLPDDVFQAVRLGLILSSLTIHDLTLFSLAILLLLSLQQAATQAPLSQFPNLMDDSVRPRTREQEFLQRRQEAHHAFHNALQTQRTCNPSQNTRASAEVARCRRLLLSLSGAIPTSSDDEVGRVPLGTLGRIAQRGPQRARQSSDEDYYSTSSTSSSGSGRSRTRDLELKSAVGTEYQKRPEDVLSGFHILGEHSGPLTEPSPDAAACASNLNRRDHDAGCHSVRDRMEHCNCSRKEARLMRRQARREQRGARWFVAKRVEEEEAEANADNEWME
ncbi:hypothetical protein B0H14DRAFT_2624652 [Mycena olivaceomarginata]|nr:hypothetical protein B0H14DRAFT_2624652 [Mycena olivaceomarginata]